MVFDAYLAIGKIKMFLIGSMRKRDTRLKFENATHTFSTNKIQLQQPLQLEATWWHKEFINSLPGRNHQGFWLKKSSKKRKRQANSKQATNKQQKSTKKRSKGISGYLWKNEKSPQSAISVATQDPSILITCYQNVQFLFVHKIKQNYICSFHKILTFMLGFPKTYIQDREFLKKDDLSATDPTREFYLVSKFKQSLFYLLQVTSISCLVTSIDCNRDDWSSRQTDYDDKLIS